MRNTNENKFYVYVYRDPRNDVPFYVGKGEGRRYTKHISMAKSLKTQKENNPVYNKIKKLWREGVEPKIEKVAKNLTEEEAFEKEIFLIEKIGRRKSVGGDGSGPLLNRTDGGEGMSGYEYTEEHRRKIGEASAGEKNAWYGKFGPEHPRYGTKNTEEHKEKLRRLQKGTTRSKEQREKISKSLSGPNHPLYGVTGPGHPAYGRKLSEEHIEAIRQSRKGKPLSQEHRDKISKANTGKKRTPEQCKEISERGKKYYEGHLVSEETRKKISESGKKFRETETPEHKEAHYNKVSKALTEYYQTEEGQETIRQANEKKQAKMPEISKKLSIANMGKPSPMKGKKLSEETKRKISESLKKRYDEGMVPANLGKKFSEETRKKMSESAKRKAKSS